MPTFTWPTERPHNATVRSVHDGDTIKCDIDMDLRSALVNYPIRLIGCNAWELATDAGKAARDNLSALLPPGTPVVLTLIKDYKYGGEFVAKVWLGDRDLIADLIAAQWAAPYDGTGKMTDHVPPWPRTVT